MRSQVNRELRRRLRELSTSEAAQDRALREAREEAARACAANEALVRELANMKAFVRTRGGGGGGGDGGGALERGRSAESTAAGVVRVPKSALHELSTGEVEERLRRSARWGDVGGGGSGVEFGADERAEARGRAGGK